MTPEAWLVALGDEDARRARQAFTRCASAAITAAGEALSVLPPDDAVRGLAIITGMGGALATGACDLLDAGNGYAAAGLVRQIVEVEYLWWTFADDAEDAARWLHASRSQLESRFRPGQMRKRSEGRFRSSEYQAHCDQGGHPSPAGQGLLAESSALTTLGMLRVDLGQHLERGWDLLVDACAAVDRVGAVRRDAPAVAAAHGAWHEVDALAQRLPLDWFP